MVLDAALGLLREGGASALTFAALAARCGLSAPTLVQRFENKAALRRRALLHAWDELDALTRKLDAEAPLTPEGAVELLIGLSEQYGGIDSYGDGLLLLREDVRDPVLRARGAAWERELTAALDSRFDAPGGVGYALAAYWQGALVWWAFRPETPLEEYLRERLTGFVAMLDARPRRRGR
jgi:AcrR family transcriptional regulator